MVFLNLVYISAHATINIRHLRNIITAVSFFTVLFSYLGYFSLHADFIMLFGDLESNRGPRSELVQSFSICHWIDIDNNDDELLLWYG